MSTDIIRDKILQSLGFKDLNSMQELSLEHGSKGKSLKLLSPTGSGKTIAFLSVVLTRLNSDKNGITALIVVPSRELALQIETVFRSLKSKFKITCCYGGHSVQTELQSLKEVPSLIIGTPGRILDHIVRNSVDLSLVDLVVLDEFDKLLQMGFEEDIGKIFANFKDSPQVILTSATTIEELPFFLGSSEFQTIDNNSDGDTNLKINFVRSVGDFKVETLVQLVAHFNQEPTIVFCNHREAVERISYVLKKLNFEHGILHGAMEQIDREKSLIKFRSGAHNVLIATDLASRGLDVPVIKHVVHFQCPIHVNEFIHRNGRTARMHADGAAYMILTEEEEFPSYLKTGIEEFELKPMKKSLPAPEFSCIYVSAGKKDNVSRGDILGFLTKSGGLNGTDIGLISVLDKSSYVAVSRLKVDDFLKKIKDPKIKKVKVKIQLAT